MAVLFSTEAYTHLLPGEAQRRRDRDRAYMMSLTTENILRAHYLEAGLIRMNDKPEDIHWGWDSPTSENTCKRNIINNFSNYFCCFFFGCLFIIIIKHFHQ